MAIAMVVVVVMAVVMCRVMGHQWQMAVVYLQVYNKIVSMYGDGGSNGGNV